MTSKTTSATEGEDYWQALLKQKTNFSKAQLAEIEKRFGEETADIKRRMECMLPHKQKLEQGMAQLQEKEASVATLRLSVEQNRKDFEDYKRMYEERVKEDAAEKPNRKELSFTENFYLSATIRRQDEQRYGPPSNWKQTSYKDLTTGLCSSTISIIPTSGENPTGEIISEVVMPLSYVKSI